jgi:hypothetical protein
MNPYFAVIVPLGDAPAGAPGVPTHPIAGAPGSPSHPIAGTPPSIWPGGSPTHPIVLPPQGPPPQVPPGMVLIMVYTPEAGWRWAVVEPEAVHLPSEGEPGSPSHPIAPGSPGSPSHPIAGQPGSPSHPIAGAPPGAQPKR